MSKIAFQGLALAILTAIGPFVGMVFGARGRAFVKVLTNVLTLDIDGFWELVTGNSANTGILRQITAKAAKSPGTAHEQDACDAFMAFVGNLEKKGAGSEDERAQAEVDKSKKK